MRQINLRNALDLKKTVTLTFKPFISIILNVSNDHLDRYNYSIKDYTRAKFNISSNQDSNDYLIINTRCKHSSQFPKHTW